MNPVSENSSAADLEALDKLNTIAEEQTEVEKKESVEEQATAVTQPANDNAELAEKVEALRAEVNALHDQQAAEKKEEVAPVKPALNLKKISKEELKKLDKKLVEKHFKDGAKKAEWDANRRVVILEKSGKYRAYKIGAGAAPAIIESKSHKDVRNFVNSI